jgi:hypothetical protein
VLQKGLSKDRLSVGKLHWIVASDHQTNRLKWSSSNLQKHPCPNPILGLKHPCPDPILVLRLSHFKLKAQEHPHHKKTVSSKVFHRKEKNFAKGTRNEIA